jgi:hypothetical protein
MPAASFLERVDELFAAAPVRELRVTSTTATEFYQLVNSTALVRLEALDLSDSRLGDLTTSGMVRGAHPRGLRRLRVRGCGITDDGARDLARADFRPGLVELDVCHNLIGHVGINALLERFGDAVRYTPPE